jgi:hypothetical protein
MIFLLQMKNLFKHKFKIMKNKMMMIKKTKKKQTIIIGVKIRVKINISVFKIMRKKLNLPTQIILLILKMKIINICSKKLKKLSHHKIIKIKAPNLLFHKSKKKLENALIILFLEDKIK